MLDNKTIVGYQRLQLANFPRLLVTNSMEWVWFDMSKSIPDEAIHPIRDNL